MRRTAPVLIFVAVLAGRADAADGRANPGRFEATVRPVLIDRCVKCHGPAKQRGGLRLDTRAAMLKGGESGAAVVPGKAGESLLLEMVESGEMPPKGEPRLTAAQVAELRAWLDAGAPLVDRADPAASKPDGRDHWAFHPPDRVAVLAALKMAATGQTKAPAHPIDAFVASRLAETHLASAPPASRRTLVRRAYFDLIGLPPSPEQVERFVNDPSPSAWENLIAELLASPHYGERWGRHWLDVARYADSGGYETDIYYRNAWRYRDYVVKSLNDDKPFDRFVQEQVAGDEIWPDDLDLDGTYVMAPSKVKALEAHTGTGFYALGPQIHESGMDAPKSDNERLTDWVDATGSAFLGLTVGCARCHDHKFDPITQRDYYGLQAVFARSREVERTIINAMEVSDFKQHYPRILAVVAAKEAYRRHEQSIAGHPPSAADAARSRELLEAIGRAVLAVPDRAASSPGTPFDGLLEVPVAAVLGHVRRELVKPVRVLQRGDVGRPKERVTPSLPAALAGATGVPAALPDGPTSRKALALWMTRPDHPLTARVIVNRVWQWHTGRGLVPTPSDFGHMGQPPSHPELLDWLATEFVANGWSLKKLHRLIMTSETYRKASDFAPPGNVAADPDNRLLWRFNRRRLEGEAVWDNIHATAGTINLQVGGPPVIPPLADEELAALRDRYRWVVSPDPAQHSRRGLYVVSYRNFRFPLFDVFDAPANAVSSPGRDVSTVALQSLWLLNNPTAWRQAQHLAARVVRETGGRTEAVPVLLWKIALGRPPTDLEAREARELLDDLAAGPGTPLEHPPAPLNALPPARAAALAKLCLGLFNHNEFLFVD
jgi:mono/diheme cytochrome c family protein